MLNQFQQIKCTICGTWVTLFRIWCGMTNSMQQHRSCYGFLVGTTVDPPEQHICYRCLVNPEDPRYTALMRLAERRRVLWALYDQNWKPSEAELVRKLG